MPPPEIRLQCEWCEKPIPKTRSHASKYCSMQCKKKRDNYYSKASIEAREKREERLARQSTKRKKGATYVRLVEEGYAQMIVDGSMTASHAAELCGVTVAAVSRAMGAYRVELARVQIAESWEPSELALFMTPVHLFDELRAIGIDAEGTPEFERITERLAEAFWVFQHRHFTMGSRAAKMLVKPFHQEIVRDFIITFTFGLRSLILTPPRHGKSEVVIRFCAWLQIMFPNIQILWVAANTKLAIAMTRKLKGLFQHSELLREDFLPPGKLFGDDNAPKWTEDEYTLYTRTDRTLKSSTFTAIGSTSTVAGRDVDFGGIDDLEERKTVVTKDLRDKSKAIHSEIMERQEDHTGFVNIGSRQHIDDIPHALKSQEGDEAWRMLEYPAHSDACVADPEDMRAHVECMLMPEVRDYRWLMRSKREAEALGLPGRFPLRYLQKEVPLEGYIFDIPRIRAECLDNSRVIGDISVIPKGRLIAGIDPASRGTQAGFLWSWSEKGLYCVDLEPQDQGGFAGALQLIEYWARPPFHTRIFTYEDNSQQVEFFRDPRFIELRRKYGLQIIEHTTGMNKHDPELGISSMAPWYHSGFINLPYGNEESRRKVNLLLSQLELWTSDGIAGRGKTDVKMASWFPFPRIQLWRLATQEKEVESDYDTTEYGMSWSADDWSTVMGF